MAPPTSTHGRRAAQVTSALLLTTASIGVLTGCSSATGQTPDPAGASTPAAEPSAAGTARPTPEAGPTPEPEAPREVVGTVIRFSGGGSVVDVTLEEDNPTTRDLLTRLPTTLRLEEFAGREKIGYPSPGLIVEGSPGSDPEDGDLIYFTPWGNIGFYYDASGIDYSEKTIHLGSYDATPDQLAAFDDTDVTIEVVP
ncbi:hypothetical protein ASF82_05370 [Frigoribacterium sp. Leaf164]|nr:hypothetical protein ASF82_05370 [Frigoribacterium sp. Leaf164]